MPVKAIHWPSGEKKGSVSTPSPVVSRRASPPPPEIARVVENDLIAAQSRLLQPGLGAQRNGGQERQQRDSRHESTHIHHLSWRAGSGQTPSLIRRRCPKVAGELRHYLKP